MLKVAVRLLLVVSTVMCTGEGDCAGAAATGHWCVAVIVSTGLAKLPRSNLQFGHQRRRMDNVNDEMVKLLAPLTDSRRAHSIAVGRRMESIAENLPEYLRADAVTAAYLHDVGYAVPGGLGFHPIDGARLLRSLGYSPVVCHLVAFHTASVVEADVRDIDPAVFEEFEVGDVAGLELANDFMWWADLSTGPSGQAFTVDERIDEILSRYEAGSIVHTAISRSAPLLRAAAQRAAGSM